MFIIIIVVVIIIMVLLLGTCRRSAYETIPTVVDKRPTMLHWNLSGRLLTTVGPCLEALRGLQFHERVKNFGEIE